jgi:hypothetical protein
MPPDTGAVPAGPSDRAGELTQDPTLSNMEPRPREGKPRLRADVRLTMWLRAALLAVSGLVFASWLVVAAVHVDDGYGVGHVTGTWFALARYVNEGVVYPPLFNGDVFGGTRYMPLQFVMHAGLARVTGEYLASGKLLAYASAIALCALVFLICRRISGSSVLALGLVASLLSTRTAFSGSTTVRGDTLPVALQLGALYAVTPRRAVSWRPFALAGVLCALAFFSKTTAIWAAVALVVWLIVKDRRRSAVFAAWFVGSCAALFALFEWVSDGRLWQNVFGLATAGQPQGPATHVLKEIVRKFVEDGQTSAIGIWLLVPFALLAVGAGIAHRRLSVYQISLIVAVVVLLRVLADVGASDNHLIDSEALTAIVTAEAVALCDARRTVLAWPLVALAIIWGTLTSYYLYLRPPTAVAAKALLGRDNTYSGGPALESLIGASDRILSEDPYVPVSHDQDPVVLDSFMLIRIAREHPEWQAEFIRQIRRHRFTKVVLFFRLQPGEIWWKLESLGTPISTAIARNYRLAFTPGDPRSEGYYIYVPAG